MVTSAEFDKVLVPVDYQNNVLMRTFDTLIGFNKKNKKGKLMKAIKEEWENGKWVDKTAAQKEAEARHKAIQNKIDSGAMKVVNLDASKAKKEKKTTTEKKTAAEKKVEDKKLYTGTLLNKVGKTQGQIAKELRDKISAPRTIKKEIVEPGDTHYTVQEIADYVWKHSPNARAKFASDMALRDKLLVNEKLRKKLDEKIIAKIGHKPEKKTRNSTPSAKKEKIQLETDLYKIADWFWEKRKEDDFKKLFPGVGSYAVLFRTIKNDDRGPKFFAELMRDRGYRKEGEKPFASKVTVIKKEKPEAAKSWPTFEDAIKVLKAPIKRVQDAYKDADQRIGIGINWTMEELFGTGWEKI